MRRIEDGRFLMYNPSRVWGVTSGYEAGVCTSWDKQCGPVLFTDISESEIYLRASQSSQREVIAITPDRQLGENIVAKIGPGHLQSVGCY